MARARTYKRYFYRKLVSGEMQWEYPAEDPADLCIQAPPPPPPLSPPPLSPPSPPPPPRISDYDADTRQPRLKKKKRKGERTQGKLKQDLEKNETVDFVPNPPPVQSTAKPEVNSHKCSEPLPPGIDLPELPYIVAKPRVQDLSDIDGVEIDTEDESTEPLNKCNESVNNSSPASKDIGKQSFVPPAIIAKPPAKVSLHAELDSFYSDLASLERAGVIPAAAEEQVDDPVEQSASQKVSVDSDTVTTEVKKKKKSKLTPGLSLKKKGVSSLVAKWQQVQQEVRRDYKNIDSKDPNVQN